MMTIWQVAESRQMTRIGQIGTDEGPSNVRRVRLTRGPSRGLNNLPVAMNAAHDRAARR